MVVVAHISPLNYLILIEADSVLLQLYSKVGVPAAVIRELQHDDVPRRVPEWIANPPEWLRSEDVPATQDTAVDELEAGEREAIILVDTQGQDRLFRCGGGTARFAIARLGETNLHVPPRLLKLLLDRDVARKL